MNNDFDVEMIVIDDSSDGGEDSPPEGNANTVTPISIRSSRASTGTIQEEEEEDTSDTASVTSVLEPWSVRPQVYMVTETWIPEDGEEKGFRVLAIFDSTTVANKFAERYAQAVEARANRQYLARWRNAVRQRWESGTTFGPDEEVPYKREACLEQRDRCRVNGTDGWTVHWDRETIVEVTRWGVHSGLGGVLSSDRPHILQESVVCLEDGDVDGTYLPGEKELDEEDEQSEDWGYNPPCAASDRGSTGDSDQNQEENGWSVEDNQYGEVEAEDLLEEARMLQDDREKPVDQVVAEAIAAAEYGEIWT